MQVPVTVDYWHVIPVVILALSSVLCCSKSGLAFLVHRPQLKPHKEVLYVRGIVTCFGHNTSLLYYTASLLPLTLP